MRFGSYKFVDCTDLKLAIEARFDNLVIGRYADARSTILHDSFREDYNVFTFHYDHENLIVTWQGREISLRDLESTCEDGVLFNKKLFESCLFDITTLNVSEIIILLRLAQLLGVDNANFVYGESMSYNKYGGGLSDTSALDDRDFNLSLELPDFKPVPFATFSPTRYPEARGVVFFGFEQERISKLFYDNERISEHDFFGIFQVPPSKPGWENDSISRHHDFLHDQRECFKDFFYTASTDPNSTYSLIRKIVTSVAPNIREKIFFVPTGSKPMSLALAAAWYDKLSEGIIFDYPKMVNNRSNGLSNVHYYVFSLKGNTDSIEK